MFNHCFYKCHSFFSFQPEGRAVIKTLRIWKKPMHESLLEEGLYDSSFHWGRESSLKETWWSTLSLQNPRGQDLYVMMSLRQAAPWKCSKTVYWVVTAARLLYKSGRLVDTQIKEMFLNLFTADGESSCINIIISKAINLSSTATDSAAWMENRSHERNSFYHCCHLKKFRVRNKVLSAIWLWQKERASMLFRCDFYYLLKIFHSCLSILRTLNGWSTLSRFFKTFIYLILSPSNLASLN